MNKQNVILAYLFRIDIKYTSKSVLAQNFLWNVFVAKIFQSYLIKYKNPST